MYEIKGLTKEYSRNGKAVRALRGVDVAVPDADLLAVQAPPDTASPTPPSPSACRGSP